MSFQQNINKTIGAVGVASRANDIRNLKGEATPSDVQINPVGQLKNIEPEKVQNLVKENLEYKQKAKEIYLQRVVNITKAREAKKKNEITDLKAKIKEMETGGKQ